jgi:hypothetical protein
MIAGFSGHQDLGDEVKIQWVRCELERLLPELNVESGCVSLAAGADQLFADVLLKNSLPYKAIIPCRRYEETFGTEERAKYFFLLSKARERVDLDFEDPSEIAFHQAGKRVVEESSLLIAVWDGQRAHGLGGTGDIVRYALQRGKVVVHINHLLRTVEQIDGLEDFH